MSFWDELSSSTGSPTGTAITEDPFARAVRIYQMELANADAAAGARRADPRAFGDTEADIQQEVIDPFMEMGSALLAPFQRSGRSSRGESRPAAPIIRGSAASGYFSVDPITGQTRDIREPAAQAQRVGQLDIAKYRSAQSILSDITAKPRWADAQVIVDEIERKYSSPEAPTQSSPAERRRGEVKFFGSPQDEMAGLNLGFQAGSAMPVQQQQPLSFPGMMPGYGGDLSGFAPQGNAAPRPAPSIRILNVRRKQ